MIRYKITGIIAMYDIVAFSNKVFQSHCNPYVIFCYHLLLALVFHFLVLFLCVMN